MLGFTFHILFFCHFFRFIELQLLRHIKNGVDLIFEVFFLWLRIMCCVIWSFLFEQYVYSCFFFFFSFFLKWERMNYFSLKIFILNTLFSSHFHLLFASCSNDPLCMCTFVLCYTADYPV